MSNFQTFGREANHQGASGRRVAFDLSPTVSGEDALRAADIDWAIEARPMSDFVDAPNGDQYHASFRSTDGRIVGINGSRYHVIQNDVLAELGDAVRSVRPDAYYEFGGQKDGGSTTFLGLGFSDPLDLGNGDLVARQLIIGTGHNGGSLFSSGLYHRFHCTNQWTSLGGKNRLFSIRHTASSEQRIAQAHYILQAAVAQWDKWDQFLLDLRSKQIDSVGSKFARIAGNRPEKEGRARTLWEQRVDALFAEYRQDFNEDLQGTALGVVMAAQAVDEHGSRCKRGMRDEQRVGRLINGNYPMARRAVQLVGA